MVNTWLLFLGCVAMVTSDPCDQSACKLPSCRCYDDASPPGGLQLSEIPQIIMVSMYGTLNSESFAYYEPIFSAYTNPNGCPVRGTFFVQDQGTDYGLLRSFYGEGHEVGIQSEDGTTPTSPTEWIQMYKNVLGKLKDNQIDEKSVYGVRAPQLSEGGTGQFIDVLGKLKDNQIDEKTVYGVRAPQLSEGGTGQFIGIGDLGLLYDSSCSSVQLSSPNTMIWPYTLDYDGPSCDTGSAPGMPFPGRWEVPVADLYDLTPDKVPCVVPSACRNVTTKKDAFDVLFNAFKAHYEGQKVPFNLIVDPVWAKNTDFRAATIEFLEYVRAAFGDNVWIVPIYKTLQWIQDPTPMANLSNFKPWSC